MSKLEENTIKMIRFLDSETKKGNIKWASDLIGSDGIKYVAEVPNSNVRVILLVRDHNAIPDIYFHNGSVIDQALLRYTLKPTIQSAENSAMELRRNVEDAVHSTFDYGKWIETYFS